MSGIARIVAGLCPSTIDVQPIDRDWSEGYGDEWEYIAAPCCQHCGDYASYIDGEGITSLLGAEDDASDAIIDRVGSWDTWRCVDPACEGFGEEIDERGDGPMMNYAYPFPDSLSESDASKIAHLPLCVVRWDDGRAELALTGGGMDLSWEICEAFVVLGHLPPAHFADLPGMCGRGDLSSGGEYGATPSDRDAIIMAACRRTAEVMRDQATDRAARILANLDRMSEKAA